MIKRFFDIILSFSLLLLFIPCFAILYLMVCLKLGRPALFVQQRPGRYGRPFHLIKFRTMTNRYDSSGSLLPDKERISSFGSLLRSTSIDELPEIVNVLKGEMSFVGPRPLLMEYLPLYSSEQSKRHNVRPGITGWAQVNGRNAVDWPERLALDIWYVENQSFSLDMRIFFMTVRQVLSRKGVSQEGHVTMSKFTGTKSND